MLYDTPGLEALTLGPSPDGSLKEMNFKANSPSMKQTGLFEEQKTFGVIGATVLDNFGLKKTENMIGESILKELE